MEITIAEALDLYVDGSSFYVDRKRHTRWAVCTQDGALIRHGQRTGQSAQVAELYAIAEACDAMIGYDINTYTDSRYAFGVVHDYVGLWANRGYLTSAGSPIQNGGVVERLHKTSTGTKVSSSNKSKGTHQRNRPAHRRE